MLKKNEVYEVTIEGYTSEGMGVARVDGQVLFVKNAVNGEKCAVKILKVGKNISYAMIDRIVEPSCRREEPVCPVYGKCGGCGLMHMDYEEELAFKRQKVENALSRLGGVSTGLERIVGAESPYHYRNKVIFAVADGKNGPEAGFYRKRSHDVVEAAGCLIQSEVTGRAAGAVLRWMRASGASAYDEKTGCGLVRHIFVRYGFATRQAQVTVVAAGKELPEKKVLIKEVLEACPETAGIILNINRERGNTVLGERFITLWGKEFIMDELCSLSFKLSPGSFYQVNHDQAERLYSIALEYAGLTGTEAVLDMYCGTGTITLCMATGAKRVIGAEIVQSAVDDAKENAERNGVKNAEFICADAADTAKMLLERGFQPDVVTVDPPRKGLSPDVIGHICSMEPQRIVYVSCDPATLGRDIKLFTQKGYEVIKASAVDMFPRTHHVETVVLLSKKQVM